MRKLIIISAFLLAIAFQTAAQRGLNVAKIFDGRYAKLPQAVATYVTGEAVEKYDIRIYRSLSMSCDPKTSAEVEQLVLKDGLKATDKETVFKGGHLRYGSFILPRQNNDNRYIFFVNKDANSGNSRKRITVVYMAGEASPDKIKSLINCEKSK